MTHEEFLDRVRSKTVEVGDCWEWKGAMREQVPVMWDPDRKSPEYVRRQIGQRRAGFNPKLWYVSVCGNPLCVNPDHVEGKTRSAVAKKAAKKNGNGKRPDWLAAIAASKRKSSKLTQELVDQIRSSSESGAEIARRLNMHRTTISAVRRYETWRDFNNPFFQLIA